MIAPMLLTIKIERYFQSLRKMVKSEIGRTSIWLLGDKALGEPCVNIIKN